ncbi:hypothetical protein SAMN05444003_1466 [Cognatiyoonia sediminum]|uniref:Lipoprotein n=1 Tax=Cognatiyoonia sediminum TaxID=1508389 RepID=A0A1M5NK88_9RHOB|nr:hypothetical protein SAMN05444003_1466 [Cognatiyoonia sediminum]
MQTITRSFGLVAVSALVLSGCSQASVRGTPASSPEECRSDWQQERQRAGTSVTSTESVGAVIASIFVSAVATTAEKDAANQRFRACLERFGIEDPQAYLQNPGAYDVLLNQARGNPAGSSRSAPISPCPAGSSVMRAGTQYCVGLK